MSRSDLLALVERIDQKMSDEARIAKELYDIFYTLSSGFSPIHHLEGLMKVDRQLLRSADHEVHSVLRNVFDGGQFETECAKYLQEAIKDDVISEEELVKQAKQVYLDLSAGIDRFESVFLSGLTRESQLKISAALKRGDHAVPVGALLGHVRDKGGFNSGASIHFILAKAYLETRATGFFRDIKLSSAAASDLQLVIRSRLLEENRTSNRVMRQVAEHEFGL